MGREFLAVVAPEADAGRSVLAEARGEFDQPPGRPLPSPPHIAGGGGHTARFFVLGRPS
jgi:hypothetical protein